MPKKKTRPKSKKKPMSKMPLVIAVAAIAIVAIIVLSLPPSQTPSEKPYIPTGQEKNYRETSTGNACTSNLQCFVASCKSNPSVVNCINSTAQEVYYVNCKGYVDVSVVRNSTKCACVQSACQMVR